MSTTYSCHSRQRTSRPQHPRRSGSCIWLSWWQVSCWPCPLCYILMIHQKNSSSTVWITSIIKVSLESLILCTVIVVGGGIAGCATALSLAKSNPTASFLLIDDAQPSSFKVSFIQFTSYSMFDIRELDRWITTSWGQTLAAVFVPNATHRARSRHYERNAPSLCW